MDTGRYELSSQQLADWKALHEKYPGWRKRWELTAAYARARGGLALRFWRLKAGPAFDEPHWWSLDSCAEALGVPVSDLSKIGEETKAWVQPRLEADRDWQELQARSPQDLMDEVRRDPPHRS